MRRRAAREPPKPYRAIKEIAYRNAATGAGQQRLVYLLLVAGISLLEASGLDVLANLTARTADFFEQVGGGRAYSMHNDNDHNGRWAEDAHIACTTTTTTTAGGRRTHI